MTWSSKYGFVGINAAGLCYATNGMNDAGLTAGVLFYPGFAEFQQSRADQQPAAISSIELANYLLGSFKTVDEVRQTMPKLRDTAHPAVVHGPIVLDPVAGVGDHRPLGVGVIEQMPVDRVHQGLASTFALDRVRTEDVEDRSADFSR